MSSSLLVAVNVLASITAMYMCLSPLPSLYRVYQQKDTGHLPALPLITQWIYNHIWMLYGYLVHSYFPLIATYAVGSVLSILYLSLYYYWAKDRRRMVHWSTIACVINAITAFLALSSSTFGIRHQIKQMIGILTIVCGLMLYASPFGTIRHVLRTKDSISIPIHMVIVGTISNCVWCLYGILVNDWIIAIPTVVNIILGILQLILYWIYRPKNQNYSKDVVSDNESTSEGTESAGESDIPSPLSIDAIPYELASTPQAHTQSIDTMI